MNDFLYDFLVGLWALRWVLLFAVALVAGGLWVDHLDVRRRLKLVANGAAVLPPMTVARRPPQSTNVAPSWWYVEHQILHSDTPAGRRGVVVLQVDPDTARELATSWESFHRADVTRDVLRPTWAAECDQLAFEAIQAEHQTTTPDNPVRVIELHSDPPAPFPVLTFDPRTDIGWPHPNQQRRRGDDWVDHEHEGL